jgi:hypothetical protein
MKIINFIDMIGVLEPLLNDWSGLIYGGGPIIPDGFRLGCISRSHGKGKFEHPLPGIGKGFTP